MSIIISVLAFLVTVGQWHLQRVHNEKSVKPLGQVYFWDRDKTIAVRVVNNGLGPLIIDQLTFNKSGISYLRIEDCVDLDPTSYRRISANDSVQRVILPNSHLTIFETIFEDSDCDAYMDRVRLELSAISLNVNCRDIYDNKIGLERSFQWFSRYILKDTTNQ
ncbi:hypothetical protein EHT25_26780 [Larkinella rosea]|uniref:Uncharacterized protein n=1 Tax=Larkinella rosea TaxID=2025312 RepID=A0A3P1BEW2_9BACT|nr:hypothetical protein EHT25_26780 [Larkinella rosea]